MDMPPEKNNIPESNKTDQGKPIRVLHVFASLDRGGAEAMIMSLYRAIDRSKIQFDFVVNASDCDYAYEEEIRALGGRIYRIPRYRVVNLFEYRKSWIKLLKAHPEWRVVHGHHTAPASVYIPIVRRMGQATIAHSQNSLVKENRVKWLMRKIVLFPVRYQADHLFACSKLAGEWMFGSSADFRVINNAINASDFVFSSIERKRIRSEFDIGDSFLIGHVGSFSEQKNHAFLLEVFRDIYKRDADAKLLLVGDGPLRLELESLVKKYGIEDRVIFAGVRSDIPALLSAMDLFLFPSFHEGLPVALVEAQANGLPI
ncbi:glycosyltransferase, partial [Akkermansiaceae bacterium]|nr:glycosyltransferase [Akkermansiaceae bacterium]